ncbi:MAG: tetratricopeptide repeat protein [Flavipsychrobacter sp.]|nr:tetratricopeptide repeat protein [Flavipsychrobacter sp.]
MRYTFTLAFILLMLHDDSRAQQYTKADSLKAKSYWDNSWNFTLYSAKHQLYLDSALMVIPTHAYYWQQKSMPLYKAKKYELGKPFLDNAVKYDAAKWLEYRAYMRCIFEKNYKGALEDFYVVKNKYNNIYVMDHPYDFYIGLCHLQLNRFDSSKAYIKGCVEDRLKKYGADWVHPNHWFYLGIIEYEQEHYTNAIEAFDKAIKLHPKFSDAYYYKGMCQYELHDNTASLASMQSAIQYLNEGYSIREDGALYELFPYQIHSSKVNAMIRSLEKTKQH